MNEISTNAVTHPPRAAQRAAAREAARAAAIASATIGYPPELPVSQRRDDIAAAIRDHQVVIVAGETGSGKTTQLPKICLELGRGVAGQIGHTQPRRIAARTVAERIAEELKTDLGDVVGYKVRFTDKSGDNTAVKLMTDGILLAEIGSDRNLRRYDTLIIDEAHERSLNIDFILGYLRQLLPRRPDLKVIITSATIDPERFAEHFKDARTGQPAPIIEVSGRTYPVEVRYRPVNDAEAREEEDRDQVQAISDAIGELEREGPGDILVFLSGEREIRDTADALKGRPKTDVLPLYARLSAAEQHRVFEPSKSSQLRRIVLATNVAETSLTVPGIRYVIDPGTARISRYSLRTKVQRLPIEPISQASANQRKGRCGRVADGICIRLYSQEDFESQARVHRPRDPAHQPRVGHPPDGRRPPRRRPQVPVRRPARPARDHRRRPAARRAQRDGARHPDRDRPPDGPAPGRPPHRPDDHRVGQAGLRPRDPGDRRRALDPGPARAPERQPAGGRHRPPPLHPAGIGLRRVRRALGLPGGEAARAHRLGLPPPVPGRVPQLPARSRVAGSARPALVPRSRAGDKFKIIIFRTVRGSHLAAQPACSPTSA